MAPKEPETRDPSKELEAKQVEYYSAIVQAWLGTRMERDRTIVTLSAGGIGLLVTLLTAVGVSTPWAIVPFIGAFLGFSTALGVAIAIFKLNADYLEAEITKKTERPPLGKLDWVMMISFGLGVIFSIVIGIVAATHRPAPSVLPGEWFL
jgi:hypothetical protein